MTFHKNSIIGVNVINILSTAHDLGICNGILIINIKALILTSDCFVRNDNVGILKGLFFYLTDKLP